MASVITTVAIILEPDAAQRIVELSNRAHLWVSGTPENRRAIGALWAHRRSPSPRIGVTVFNVDPSPPAQVVSRYLSEIDLHHGSHSQTPQWNRAEVYGAPLTAQLRVDLTSYGFDKFEEMPSGFVATRTKPFADS